MQDQKTALMVIMVISGIVFAPPVLAESRISESVVLDDKTITNSKVVTAGITPDSVIWPLDVAVKRLSLLVTLDQTAKAHRALEIARERLLEVRQMILENKPKAAAKAEEEHKLMLKVASDSSLKLKKNNPNGKKELSEINQAIKEREKDLDSIKGFLKSKKDAAAERIEAAKTALNEVKSKIANREGMNVTMQNSVNVLVEKSQNHLQNAEIAFNETQYGKAFGQATASMKIAENIETIIE